MAVEPSLIASREYSTWKRRPSGEKVLEGGGVRSVGLGMTGGGVGGWGCWLEGGEAYLIPRSVKIC
jgi:hypothetical protein